MAVTVSLADFRAQFPELATRSDAAVQRAIEEAYLLHRIRKLATMYAAAHVLTVNDVDEAGESGSSAGSVTVHGEISMKKVGPLSLEYTTTSGTQTGNTNTKSAVDVTFFSRTEYGRHFLALEARSARAGMGAMVVG